MRLNQTKNRNLRRGYTLVEVLVAIAIITLLIGLLFVGVQAARESARRASCQNNLRQIGLALANYESANRVLPYGHCRQGFSAHVHILPFVGEQALYDQFDVMKSELDPQNRVLRQKSPGIYSCPTAAHQGGVAISYFGNGGTGVFDGNNGSFIIWKDQANQTLVGQINASSFTDGLSNTVMVGEVLNNEPELLRSQMLRFEPRRELNQTSFANFARDCFSERDFARALPRVGVWSRGDPGNSRYFHILGPNKPTCSNDGATQELIMTAGSKHPGGVQVLLADGSTHWKSDSIQLPVWRELGSRDNSESELSLW